MQRPPQRPQQGRPLQPNMPGSQNNPIEIVTPVMNAIPQLANQPNMGPYMTPLQPAAQINEQRYQQPPTQPRPPQHPATQQWVQQQQQPRPPVMTNPPAQPKPWAGMDFSKDPFPMSEEQFWKYLGSQHLKRPEPMPAPVIEGKPVNLYGLFNLVHKNGGSAKVCSPDESSADRSDGQFRGVVRLRRLARSWHSRFKPRSTTSFYPCGRCTSPPAARAVPPAYREPLLS